MQVKICTKCCELLPLDSFYKKVGNKLKSECKKCHLKYSRERHILTKEKRNAQMKAHYQENKEQYQKKHAEYRRSEHGKEIMRAGTKRFLATEKGRDSMVASARKWIDANRIKARCHWNVKTALGDGRLTKNPCEVCGEVKSEAHHPDYSKPLDVVWLCRDHHKKLHRTVA